MKASKASVTLLLILVLITPFALVKTTLAQPTTLGLAAPQIPIQVYMEFNITLNIQDVTDLSVWVGRLSFDPSQVQFMSATEGPFLATWGLTYFFCIEESLSVVYAYDFCLPMPNGTQWGVSGSGILAYFTFHCIAQGTSPIHLYDTQLFDSAGTIIPHATVDATVTQTTAYWKPSYTDYAPSGVPDFSQKQIGPAPIGLWKNSYNQWSWCGPTAVANSLWWMDSRFETSTTPPPTKNDTFPLVQSYNAAGWDDHAPQNVPYLIANLSRYMDTDGARTGIAHNGTEVHDMTQGIQNYILDHGLQDKFYVNLLAKPTFAYITAEVTKCEDTILLLGFWQPTTSGWKRIGGHFVTVPGVDSANRIMYFCDPFTDNAELTGQGVVIPPPPHNHPAPPDTVHNNATFVSYDAYSVIAGASPSPGGQFGINYNLTQYYDLFPDVQQQNCPNEFGSIQGNYNQSLPVFTEVEYGVFVSPSPPPMYWKPGYPDYAPSGMPDFDERQWDTYNWTDPTFGIWSHCAPVAEANSLWWLDSEFESGSIPPPTKSDHFTLITSYNSTWDDHDPRNVPYLIEHLAYLMDTDGRRLQFPPLAHTGTSATDMETGLAQYLSWSGVNPIGDVNGDGVVNGTDLAIVVAANNTIPGMPRWNMAADIYPVTLGWPSPGKADNVVNQTDIDLVNAHMGQTGMFCERTVPAPDFGLIDKEVQKCEDVVLTIGFWTYLGGIWYPPEESSPTPYPNTGKYGHALTVAGVNSTTLQIAVSDPAFDNFEAGGQGRSPVPHIHSTPEPPYTTHNNASLVSQDIYNVTWLSPPLPPCPGGNWTIVGYAGCGTLPPPAPQTYAVIENAVIISLLVVHDVAVTNVTSPKTVICQGYTGNVTITVENHGGYTETFNVTAYANNTATGNTTSTAAFINVTLVSGASTSLVSVWNTTGFAKGNYTLSAYAWPVPGETDTADNNFTDGLIVVSMVGDLTGAPGVPWPGLPDGKVDGKDLTLIAKCFGSWPGAPPPMTWTSNADINDDGKVDGKDLTAMAVHFGQSDP
jgi:hypothetical protein